MDLSSIEVSPLRLDRDLLDRDLLDRDLLDRNWVLASDLEVAPNTPPRSGDMSDFSLPRTLQHSSKPDGTKPDVVFRDAPPREP
jgi:hypothetical protein